MWVFKLKIGDERFHRWRRLFSSLKTTLPKLEKLFEHIKAPFQSKTLYSSIWIFAAFLEETPHCLRIRLTVLPENFIVKCFAQTYCVIVVFGAFMTTFTNFFNFVTIMASFDFFWLKTIILGRVYMHTQR